MYKKAGGLPLIKMAESKIKKVVGLITAGAFMASAALYYAGPSPSDKQWSAVGFFTVLGIIASGLGYKTSKATAGSIGFLPFLSIAVISPNYAALISVILSIAVVELMSRRPWIKLVFNIAQFVLAEAAAIGVYLFTGGTPLIDWPAKPLSLGAFTLMVAVWMVLNKIAVSAVVSAANDGNVKQHWMDSMRMSIKNDVLAFPLIFFFAAAYVRFGALLASALALPMLGMRQVYKANITLEKINEELLQVMVATVDAQDPYTSGHSLRVSSYSRLIAQIIGLPQREQNRISRAALLHDVGKIYSEFSPVLRKADKLTAAEFALVKTHPQRGADLVSKVSHFEDLVPLILCHHEAWNGAGYPNKFADQQIPLGARIIALADTIDAMTTSRPYRCALPPEEVRQEIARQAGKKFDPIICEKLLACWDLMEREVRSAAKQYPVVNARIQQLKAMMGRR